MSPSCIARWQTIEERSARSNLSEPDITPSNFQRQVSSKANREVDRIQYYECTALTRTLIPEYLTIKVSYVGSLIGVGVCISASLRVSSG
ncbi:hypothetical protein N7535_009584 [Penicillium sp. DV-2018c]|nr:hypothetical protein N7461_002069 [Penicillium sp. DV-2018c]KAJ5559356.1 hypothetical protein N7535_009584 [Penicillium sp. DV-2018c]